MSGGWAATGDLRQGLIAECKPWTGEPPKAFLERPIEGDWPYLWINAIYLKVRCGGRVIENFSLDQHAARHLALYEDVIARRAPDS